MEGKYKKYKFKFIHIQKVIKEECNYISSIIKGDEDIKNDSDEDF